MSILEDMNEIKRLSDETLKVGCDTCGEAREEDETREVIGTDLITCVHCDEQLKRKNMSSFEAELDALGENSPLQPKSEREKLIMHMWFELGQSSGLQTSRKLAEEILHGEAK